MSNKSHQRNRYCTNAASQVRKEYLSKNKPKPAIARLPDNRARQMYQKLEKGKNSWILPGIAGHQNLQIAHQIITYPGTEKHK